MLPHSKVLRRSRRVSWFTRGGNRAPRGGVEMKAVELIRKQWKGFALGGALLTMLLALAPPRVSADTIYSLSIPNTALSCCTGPYATVDVHLNSRTSATITFDSLTNGGDLYLMAATR